MARHRRTKAEIELAKKEFTESPVVGPQAENSVTGIYPQVKPDQRDQYLKDHTPAPAEKPRAVFYGPGGSVHPKINGRRWNIVWERIEYGPQEIVCRYVATDAGVIEWLRANGYKEKVK